MLGLIAQRAQDRVAGWARARQGPDALVTALKRRRIFILPSRFGLAYAALVLAMLLGSLNYNASLGFALTFLLVGVGLVAMHHCHNNLLGTEVRFAGGRPVCAGELAGFRIALCNDAAVPRYELRLNAGVHESATIDLEPGETRLVTLSVPAGKRGWLTLGRFSVATRHPGHLFRAWSWVHMDARCLIYPRLAAPGRALPAGSQGAGDRGAHERGDADFVGLRTAVAGDPPGRIAWKAYARNDQLLLKQFASADLEPCLLDWDSLPDLAPEERLSQLARWCMDAAQQDRAFALKLPGREIAPGSGERHLHECLQGLALFEPGARP